MIRKSVKSRVPPEYLQSDLSLVHPRKIGSDKSASASNSQVGTGQKISPGTLFWIKNICYPQPKHLPVHGLFGNYGLFLPQLLRMSASRLKIILFSSYCCSEFNQFRHFTTSALLTADPALNETPKVGQTFVLFLRISWKSRWCHLLHHFP